MVFSVLRSDWSVVPRGDVVSGAAWRDSRAAVPAAASWQRPRAGNTPAGLQKWPPGLRTSLLLLLEVPDVHAAVARRVLPGELGRHRQREEEEEI